MATKKIWSVFEVGAPYEGPLGEVEASSERSALDSAAAFFGVPRKRLYALPGGALEGAPAGRSLHATKSTSEAILPRMLGRRVKSGWHVFFCQLPRYLVGGAWFGGRLAP